MTCHSPTQELETLHLPGAELQFLPALFTAEEADALLHPLLHDTPWRQDTLLLYGKPTAVPRLQAWYGDAGSHYRYSGLRLHPLPWTSTLLHIKTRVEQHSAGTVFNSVLLNCYRHERDSVSWHSDDEPELGTAPVIASVSLGAPRLFQLRHRQQRHLKYHLTLPHGSLLLMRGNTQHHWQHQLPKSRVPTPARVNLTFRTVRTEVK